MILAATRRRATASECCSEDASHPHFHCTPPPTMAMASGAGHASERALNGQIPLASTLPALGKRHGSCFALYELSGDEQQVKVY
jgi:hypothetical protein